MLSGNTILFASLPQQLFSGTESYGLLAIPLFMLAGELMNEGGLTRRLVTFAGVFVRGVRGGLAYVNLIANMMMASIMGSALAQISVMSKVMVPEMERVGYDRAQSGAITAAGGLLSPIIPPSMLFVLFGVMAQLPIGDLFIAGIVPGLLLGLGYFGVIALIGLKTDMPVGRPMSSKEVKAAVLGGLPALCIPVVIIGGILLGIATPTESAGVAVVAAVVIGKFVYGDLKFSRFGTILLNTGLSSSGVIFLVAAANVFGWVLIFQKIPQNASEVVVSLTENPFVFMLLVNIILLFVGMIIDGIAALIMVVPILLPVAQNVYGIDPFHFGVVICINLILGLLTPPVGAGLYVASAMSRISPTRIFRALLPFLLVTIVNLILLSWHPWLVTGLID